MHHHKAVEIGNLNYVYPDGTRALKGIDLSIENGESVALLGPNGAGKSTLLLHLNAILQGSGEIKIFDLPIVRENIREIRRRVGVVFQDPDDQLFSPTVYEDVAFGPTNMGLSKEEVEKRVEKALAEVGMKGFEKKAAYHLSFGQKKRVATATVLSMEPDILALDEPSSNLDSRGRRELLDILIALPVTKIVITHDLPFVIELCERAIIMDDGSIVADGLVDELFGDEDLLAEHGLELPLGFDDLKSKARAHYKISRLKRKKL
jgi:cobalt/nickel transport system ATP-binding protein